jgi:hypothetical protein
MMGDILSLACPLFVLVRTVIVGALALHARVMSWVLACRGRRLYQRAEGGRRAAGSPQMAALPAAAATVLR